MPDFDMGTLQHSILNSLQEGLWISDRNDCVTFFNESMEKIAEVTSDQVLGLNIINDFKEETTKEFLPHYLKARTSLKSAFYEAEVTTPAGRHTFQAGWLTPLIKDGRFDGMICTITDVTEAKKTSDALEESERRWRRAIVNSPIPIMIHDEDHNVLNLSAGWTASSGYTLDELPTLADWIEQACVIKTDTVEESLNQMFSIDNAFNQREWKITAKDGSKRIWRFQTTPIGVRHQGSTVYQSLAIDETERRESEVTLRQRTQLLEASQAIAKVGGWELDLVTNHLYWTAETYRIHDTSPEEFDPSVEAGVGYFLPESRRLISEALELAISEGKGYDLDLQTHTTKGRLIDVRTTCEVTLVDGKPSKLTGIFQDITERKKLEDIMHLSQRLDSLGILAGGLAHDFNNLLSGIFGNLELALEDLGESQATTHIQNSLGNIDRARALTNQLLTFAKGGAPSASVQDLFPFVHNTVLFATSGSAASSHFDIPDNLWSVKYDQNQLGQVIDNLCINALQAMPAGGLIEVSAANVTLSDNSFQLTPGDYVRVSIKDEGSGIPAHALPKIFDPFYTTKELGQGLGLATSYSIVKRHQGSIDVETSEDTGTTFHVYLPASNEAARMPNTAEPPEHHGHGTFLIMDDDEAVRSILKRMLKTFGYTVVLASEGAKAVEYFQEEMAAGRQFAGAILDLTVPGGIGGKEAVKMIRKIASATPIFVSSGYSDDPIIADPEKYGFSASLAKPFTKNELSRLLERHIRNTQADLCTREMSNNTNAQM